LNLGCSHETFVNSRLPDN